MNKTTIALVAVLAAFAATPVRASSTDLPLTTGTGFEIGANVSDYSYHETVNQRSFAHIDGARYGVQGSAYKSFADDLFVKADGLFSYGSLHYNSASGNSTGIPDYKFDVRGAVGKDFLLVAGNAHYSLSPYIGLGYRNLSDDLEKGGLAGGYYRDSQYLYIPLGVVNRFRITEDARIATTLEYDQLIEGWQRSDLSDANSSLPNLTNAQKGGHGFRGSAMYEASQWSVGPFFEYWNIDDSKRKYEPGFSAVEPHNVTTEYGIKAAYKF